MRKMLLFALAIFVCAPLASAQSDERRPEFFIGYSNLQAEGIPSQEPRQTSLDDRIFGERNGLHGLNLEGTAYITPRFGLTGDFSFNQSSSSFTGTAANTAGEIDTEPFLSLTLCPLRTEQCTFRTIGATLLSYSHCSFESQHSRLG